MDLKDKIVLITGATGGIGYELCKAFSSKSANIVAVARTQEKLDSLSKELNSPNNLYIKCDFTNTTELTELVNKIFEKLDRIDVLINAAGVGIYKSLEDVEIAEWEESVAINVNAPFFLSKKLLKLLKNSEKSVVINIGSGMGKMAIACRSVYCATKYALRGLTLSLAQEFGHTNVRFVHIALGSTLTEFGPMTLEQKKEENLQGKSYLTPDWVAHKFVEIVEKENFQDEIEIYPTEYKEENQK